MPHGYELEMPKDPKAESDRGCRCFARCVAVREAEQAYRRAQAYEACNGSLLSELPETRAVSQM